MAFGCMYLQADGTSNKKSRQKTELLSDCFTSDWGDCHSQFVRSFLASVRNLVDSSAFYRDPAGVSDQKRRRIAFGRRFQRDVSVGAAE